MCPGTEKVAARGRSPERSRVAGVAEDIAWSYPSPVPENPRIAGLICFRNERVDLTVDGQRLERPVTPWS